MIFNLYAIKDELSEFAAPLCIEDDAQAVRFFKNKVFENRMMMDNPEDFSIWKIGKYETETAIVTYSAPEKIISAKSFHKTFIKTEEKENGN